MSEDTKYNFRGKVGKCVYNSDNFKVYAMNVDTRKYPEIHLNTYKNCSIVGDIPELVLNTEYDIVATEEKTKYGTSYRVVNIKRDKPTDEEDVIAFLKKVLTENQARVLYAEYPDIIDRVLSNRLDDVDLNRLRGIGGKSFENIKKNIVENFKLIDLIGEFKGLLSLSMLKKIYDKYSSIEGLKKKLKENPYATLTKISGVGFLTADSIIKDIQDNGIIDFGFDIVTSVDRCISCIMYLLDENEKDGNTKAGLADIYNQCCKMVPGCADKFNEAVKCSDIYYDKYNMEIALRSTYDAEKYISDTMKFALGIEDKWDFDGKKYRNVGEFMLTDEQMQAAKNLCEYKVSILNGPGGAGKSQSTLAIISMLEDNGKTFKIMTPTGKSSKVISEYTKRPASTIHRGLQYNPKMGWFYNKNNKLFVDVVIVDEVSMCDVRLFSRLIDAIDFERTRLLLIGDASQLPSVGAGNLLHDFIKSKTIPLTTLTKIFRYSDGGLMYVATNVRQCKPYLKTSMKNKTTTFGNNKDYAFIDAPQEKMVSIVLSIYKKLLDMGERIDDIRVLTSKNVGNYGTVALNKYLQKIANKNYGSTECMKIGDTVYYQEDMVMNIVNRYDAVIDVDSLPEEEKHMHEYDNSTPTAFVSNGETGKIRYVCSNYAIIDFDGIPIIYKREEMNMVKHGYACTIHRSQGSSIKNVILCTPKSDTYFLNSNLIYTGQTRTTQRCFHIGQMETVNLTVKKKADLERNTFMIDMLKSH